MLKKIIFLSLIFLAINFSAYSQKILIISKVDNDIITNIDVNSEIKYLKLLNPKLNEISDQKNLFNLGKSSLIKEIIKKRELKKYFDIEKDYNILEKIEKNLISKKDVKNKKGLKNLMKSKNLNYNEVLFKLKIEALWNEFIYQKYNKSVKINEDYLIKQVKMHKKNRKNKFNYYLYEILFEVTKQENLNDKLKIIKSSVENIGFKNTANIYGISDSAKFGGEIGWVKESQLSSVILNKIINLEIDEISETLQTPGGYLILKISKKKKIDEPFDEKKNLDLLKQYETNRQLNQFSLIHFKRLKNDALINDYR
tara:strand:+ start:409 stop:1344 length:936 start_codon:yes stop_codon:yes gene_type:complete